MIDLVFSKGHSFSNFPFKVVWLPQSKEHVLQAGVGVSSRYFKKATDRNRIKRLMREAYRLQKNELHDHLLQSRRSMSVFILYIGKDMPDYATVSERMGALLKRLIKFSNENTQEPA